MTAANTHRTYGTVTRTFHWLTALLIFTAIPLGVYANRLPYDTAEALAWKAQVFSIHKTVGILTFAVALARILWAVTQPKPAPLHPERRSETLAAEVTHWALYAALVVVPLSGWITHAAAEGFAPILWPLGQSLPLVPVSVAWETGAAAVHIVFTKVLIAAILLHVAGALKHALVDRDATLSRMVHGRADLRAVDPQARHRHAPAIAAAAALYLAGFGIAWAIVPPETDRPAAPALVAAEGGNWSVVDGSLSITVRQFGTAVTGSFADWTADITFDETPTDGRHGTVTVEVSIASLTLGSVTDQAMGPDYFNVAGFPTAIFEATILPAAEGYVADGTLTLRGQAAPLELPFQLTLDGDTATMEGNVTIDRTTYTIGASQTDPGTLGFDVVLDVALTASRTQ